MNIIRLGNSNQLTCIKAFTNQNVEEKKNFLSWILKNFQMTTHIFNFVFQSILFCQEFKYKKIEFRTIHQVNILL